MCTSICSLLCTQTCSVWFLRKWGYSNKKYRSCTVEIQFKVHIFLVFLLNFIRKVRSFDLEDLIFSVKLVFLMLVFFTPPFSCWENGRKDWFYFFYAWGFVLIYTTINVFSFCSQHLVSNQIGLKWNQQLFSLLVGSRTYIKRKTTKGKWFHTFKFRVL